MRRQKAIDADDLPPRKATAMLQCIENLSSAAPRARGGRRRPQPDRFCYTVTLEDGASRKSISFREGEEPPALRPLLAALAGPERSEC